MRLAAEECRRRWVRRPCKNQILTPRPILAGWKQCLEEYLGHQFLDLAQSAKLKTLDRPTFAHGEVGTIIRKHAVRDIDLADAALIWLANRTGVRPGLTTDRADFGVYRLKNGKRFELVRWFER